MPKSRLRARVVARKRRNRSLGSQYRLTRAPWRAYLEIMERSDTPEEAKVVMAHFPFAVVAEDGTYEASIATIAENEDLDNIEVARDLMKLEQQGFLVWDDEYQRALMTVPEEHRAMYEEVCEEVRTDAIR